MGGGGLETDIDVADVCCCDDGWCGIPIIVCIVSNWGLGGGGCISVPPPAIGGVEDAAVRIPI